MNDPSLSRTEWWPVATTRELGRTAPLSRTLLGIPMVLFRSADGTAAALMDRCPHRSAPLSKGATRNGDIECPYHGWRFDRAGNCTLMPGGMAPCRQALRVTAFHVCEQAGLVWASLPGAPPQQPPTSPSEVTHSLDVFFLSDTLRCTLAAAAENFLDPFHTHFVHAGWIRNDAQRQKIRVRVRPLPDGVEARYSGEKTQTGWISRLLEKNRGESFGRFRLPGLAEIEYRDQMGRLSLLISAWLTPAAQGETQIFARVATAAGWVPALLKEGILRRVFNVILKQDKQILELTDANRKRFGLPLKDASEKDASEQQFHGHLALLGPSIEKLLSGRTLDDLEESDTDLFI